MHSRSGDFYGKHVKNRYLQMYENKLKGIDYSALIDIFLKKQQSELSEITIY